MILFKQSVPKMFNMFYIWNISNKFRRLDFCIERHFIRQGACQGLVPIGFNWLCCKHIQHPHSEECKREHVSYFPLSCSVLPQIHKRQGLGLLWFLYTYIYIQQQQNNTFRGISNLSFYIVENCCQVWMLLYKSYCNEDSINWLHFSSDCRQYSKSDCRQYSKSRQCMQKVGKNYIFMYLKLVCVFYCQQCDRG